jgi:hypothetical protein
MGKKSSTYSLITMMILCVILVPLIAYYLGSWYAYWGHGILAIIFAIIAILLRTKFFWEDE